MDRKKYKTELIRILHQLPPVREPKLRSSRRWTGAQRDQHMNRKASNVESALMQIVGSIPVFECTSCEKEHGPWAKCIIHETPGDEALVCASCHWAGEYRRCSFYRPATAQPRTQRRSASIQEQIDTAVSEAVAQMTPNGLLI
jgi:NAD-dependent SIR2 family protein deacetylase